MMDLIPLHKKEYGGNPEVIAEAPGTLIIMGRHSRYNDGYVLAMAIDRWIQVSVSKRSDNSLYFFAADTAERKRTTISGLKFKREDRWANHLKGVISSFLQMGYDVTGLDFTIQGNIPENLGFSSNVALACATAQAIKALFELNTSDAQMLESVRHAVTTFKGKQNQIIEPLISYYAKENNLMLLDIRNLDFSYIPVNLSDRKFIITDSKVPRNYGETEEQEEEEDIAGCISVLSDNPSSSTLRDFSTTDVRSCMKIPEERIKRRCMHIVEENQRVRETAASLQDGDCQMFGKLLSKSHESLRDLFEVSCPEIDWLVKRAREIEGVYGSRILGTGFGGGTLTLLEKSVLQEYKEKLEEYERIFRFQTDYFPCYPVAGCRVTYRQEK